MKYYTLLLCTLFLLVACKSRQGSNTSVEISEDIPYVQMDDIGEIETQQSHPCLGCVLKDKRAYAGGFNYMEPF